MDDRARREEAPGFGAKLTAREIRGLLTRICADLARTAAEDKAPLPRDERARMIRPRDFVERMVPFLRMN